MIGITAYGTYVPVYRLGRNEIARAWKTNDLERVCKKCQSKDHIEDYKLSDKRGHVFTYAIDQLSWGKERPVLVGVIDFEGGGRVLCEICDCNPDEISIGMPVEMCFRKLSQNDDIQVR